MLKNELKELYLKKSTLNVDYQMLTSGSDIAKYGQHLKVSLLDPKNSNMIKINLCNIADVPDLKLCKKISRHLSIKDEESKG